MLTPIISDPRIFYVTHQYQGNVIEENPLAQGFTATPIESTNTWGVVSWFDKINGSMRTIEVSKEPKVLNLRRSYEVITPLEETFIFSVVDKNIYDTCLRQLIPRLPNLPDDASIQKHLENLNPYL